MKPIFIHPLSVYGRVAYPVGVLSGPGESSSEFVPKEFQVMDREGFCWTALKFHDELGVDMSIHKKVSCV